MQAKTLVAAWCAAVVTFLALDALWLTVLMGDTYASYLGDMMLATPRWLPAILFYLLYISALLVFAVKPALVKRDWRAAALLGALLGLASYGTYDLTNLATLRGWPWQLSVIDLAWGTFLSSVAASAGYAAGSKLRSGT